MKTESLYKNFMLVQVSHLPVLSEDGLLIGFLSKEKLQMEMADLSRESYDWETIPDEFMEEDIPESLLQYFQYQSQVPVIGIQGKRRDVWDKPRLLAEYSKAITQKSQSSGEGKDHTEFTQAEFSSHPNSDKIEKQGSGTDTKISQAHSQAYGKESQFKKKDPLTWYMRLILESFTDPLFSTDISGNAIFFNDRFEKEILSQSFFRNSVSFAERFLRDLNKDVFAAFLKANDMDLNPSLENGKVLQTIVSKIGYMVRIVTLSENEKVVGYLYHFTELGNRINNQKEIAFPSLEEAFANRMPLELVLKETESFYIYHSLNRNQKNVSHTADELEIPRSTLQNRIKQLELDKKFSESEKSPIPRKRKSKSHQPIQSQTSIQEQKADSTHPKDISQETTNAKKTTEPSSNKPSLKKPTNKVTSGKTRTNRKSTGNGKTSSTAKPAETGKGTPKKKTSSPGKKTSNSKPATNTKPIPKPKKTNRIGKKTKKTK